MKINKVILDTNALLIPGKKGGRDIFEDLTRFLGAYEAIVPSFIVDELKKKSKKGKVKSAVKFALTNILKKVKIKEVKKTSTTIDTSLLNYAIEIDAYIYTNDRNLKERALKKGVKVIYISQTKPPKRIRTQSLKY